MMMGAFYKSGTPRIAPARVSEERTVPAVEHSCGCDEGAAPTDSACAASVETASAPEAPADVAESSAGKAQELLVGARQGRSGDLAIDSLTLSRQDL